MPDFYSPNNIDPEDPYMCRCLPIKYAVAIVQFATIIFSIGLLITNHSNTWQVLLEGFFLFFMVVSFAAYSYEHKLAMLVHLWLSTTALLWVFILVCYAGYEYFSSLNKKETNGEIYFFLFMIIGFFGLAYYVWMCIQLVKAVVRKTRSLPEFDTTQGLFQFNRDHYDGSESANLLYPRL